MQNIVLFHDSLLSTSLWEKMSAGSILPQSVLEIQDQAIPPLIRGDATFSRERR